MLKLIRVRGDSMRPDYGNADYVVVLGPRWRQPRVGDDVVARHPVLGTIIKRVAATDGQHLRLAGLDPASTSSQAIGEVALDDLLGRVVLHLPAR